MNLKNVEAEIRVWSLRREYHNALKSAGYAQIMETKPHISIRHFQKKF